MEALKSIISILLAIVVVLLIIGLGIAAFLFVASIVPFIIGIGLVMIVAATIYNCLFNKN